jgi:hypothetical protein
MRLPDERVDAVVRDLGVLLSLFPEPPRQFGSTYRAKCPIHGGERLSVGIRQGNDGWVFHCFACGVKGDAINLVRELDGVGFREALDRLSSGDRRPSVALWSAPKPKAYVLPCEGKGCGERLELDAIDLVLVDVAYPSWFFKRGTSARWTRGWCPKCLRKERSGHGSRVPSVVAGAPSDTQTGRSRGSPAPQAEPTEFGSLTTASGAGSSGRAA